EDASDPGRTVVALDEQRAGTLPPGREGDARHRSDADPVARLEVRFERRVLDAPVIGRRNLAVVHRGTRLGVALSGFACAFAPGALEAALLGHNKPSSTRHRPPATRHSRQGL